MIYIFDTQSHCQQFAEVLKYLYLTFDDPSHISLDECEYRRPFSFWHFSRCSYSRGLQHRMPPIQSTWRPKLHRRHLQALTEAIRSNHRRRPHHQPPIIPQELEVAHTQRYLEHLLISECCYCFCISVVRTSQSCSFDFIAMNLVSLTLRG